MAVTLSNPSGKAQEVIFLFGGGNQETIKKYYNDPAFIQIYTDHLQGTAKLIHNLKNNISQETEQGRRRSWYTQSFTAAYEYGTEWWNQKKIETIPYLLYNVTRAISCHPPLQKYQENWKSFQEGQDSLHTHVFEYLSHSDSATVWFAFSPVGKNLLQSNTMPYLFNTAALFTPKGPIFWGNLIYEWGTTHQKSKELAENFLQIHPEAEMLFSNAQELLLSKKYFIPPFANLAEHPCDFKTFLIHRTVDALQLAIGCPFTLKMRDFLYREFDACENVRMNVSFAVTYSQKLLKEELTHANVKSLWLLRFFRTIMNLLLGHMNAGINADNTALQTLLEWVCHHYGYFSDEAMLTVEDDPFPQTPIGRVCRNRRFGAERLAPP